MCLDTLTPALSLREREWRVPRSGLQGLRSLRLATNPITTPDNSLSLEGEGQGEGENSPTS